MTTNFEQIKTFNIDQMVKFIRHSTSCIDICEYYEECLFKNNIDCNNGIRQWLNKEISK